MPPHLAFYMGSGNQIQVCMLVKTSTDPSPEDQIKLSLIHGMAEQFMQLQEMELL